MMTSLRDGAEAGDETGPALHGLLALTINSQGNTERWVITSIVPIDFLSPRKELI